MRLLAFLLLLPSSLLPLSLLETIQGANQWVYFCIYSGIHRSSLVFQTLGAVNKLLSKAEPEVVQEGSLDWGAEVTKLPEKQNFLARRAKAVPEGL